MGGGVISYPNSKGRDQNPASFQPPSPHLPLYFWGTFLLDPRFALCAEPEAGWDPHMLLLLAVLIIVLVFMGLKIHLPWR